MAKLGAVDVEIAEALQVSLKLLDLWARQHKEFLRALKPPKEVANRRTEQSLYKRANGYSYDSEELFQVPYEEEIPQGTNPDGSTKPPIIVRSKRIVREPVVKHVPPDPTSLIFWLKNRKRDQWRDYKAVEHSTATGKPLEFKQVGRSEPELIGAYYDRLRKQQGTPTASGRPASADPDPDPGVGERGQGPHRPGGGS
jgi:hypothetical protein